MSGLGLGLTSSYKDGLRYTVCTMGYSQRASCYCFCHKSKSAFCVASVTLHQASTVGVMLQELERQEDHRHGSPSTTTAAMLSLTTAETVTQGSSGTMSGSDMIPELGLPQQVV